MNWQLQDLQNPNRNRGFIFVEYYNHACAEYARQKMSSANFKIDGSTPTVSWAEPKNAADASAAAQVDQLKMKKMIKFHPIYYLIAFIACRRLILK